MCLRAAPLHYVGVVSDTISLYDRVGFAAHTQSKGLRRIKKSDVGLHGAVSA